MVASARSCIRSATLTDYLRNLDDFSRNGGLVAYRDKVPLYLCYGGHRTTDLHAAIESYAEPKS